MRFLHSLVLAAGAASAASSWGFDHASVEISSKQSGDSSSQKFTEKSPLPSPLILSADSTLTLTLTTKENGTPKRAHQAFLLLRDPTTNLEAPFPLDIKSSGKAKLELSQKDIPLPFLQPLKTDDGEAAPKLQASLVVASMGSATGLEAKAFEVEVRADPNSPAPRWEKPLRYGKMEEIHHVFKADAKSPPVFISMVFSVAVLVMVPCLLAAWAVNGANINHLSTALAAAPVSHSLFFGSIVAMEGAFFMYYATWNLFHLLPVVGVIGTVSFLSGIKALGEVQKRRVAGLR